MQGNRIIKPANKQSGFSLVELMIAIAIGLVITAAVTAMAVNSLKMNSATLKSARLNQDIGAVMQIMVNDIRRAGYTHCENDSTATPPVDCSTLPAEGLVYDDLEDINIVSSACVLYSYNRDSGSSIGHDDEDEMNGFKLDGGRMEMRISCDVTEDPNCSTSCLDSVGTWVPLTDPDVISITSLTFTTANSKCTSTDAEMSIRIKPDVSDTEFACSKITNDNVQKGIINGDGDWEWVDLPDDTGLPLDGGSNFAGVRQVNISLKGVFNDPFVETGSDYNEYPIKKSLDVSIKVRN